VLFVAALFLAGIGWRLPALSLTIPAATLVNAVFFHILPTVVQHRVSPGVYTATLLYLPFSSWAFVGAWRDGVPKRSLVVALLSGTLLMLAVVLAARWLGGQRAVSVRFGTIAKTMCEGMRAGSTPGVSSEPRRA
jgi:hypothetical protein